MTPLTLGSANKDVPENFPDLLDLLAGRPQPAVIWYGNADHPAADQQHQNDSNPPMGQETPQEELSGARVELSGRVLQNWAVKLISLLSEEADPAQGDIVLVDAAPHWKAAAVVLAAGALGCSVRLGPGAGSPGPDLQTLTGQHEPVLVVTDRPLLWAEAEALGEAKLAAVSPGLLDASYQEVTGEALPGWVLDISAEVRQHPDQLITPLDSHSLPTAGGEHAGDRPAAGSAASLVISPPSHAPQPADRSPWTRWDHRSWETPTVAKMLQSWAHSGTVVLWDRTAQGWETMLGNEGIR